MKSNRLIAGILIGAAAGTLIGVLFAPHKGTKTRKKIVDSTNDLKDSLKEKINDFVDEITDQFQDAKEEMLETAKGKLADIKAQVKHSLS